MKRVLLVAVFGLVGATGAPSVAVAPPPLSFRALFVQHAGARQPVERARNPQDDRLGRPAGALSDNPETPDAGLLRLLPEIDEVQAPSGPLVQRTPRPRPHLLLEAPKTGPPSIVPVAHG